MMCSDRIVTLALDLPLTGNSYERCMYVWVVYISQVQFTYVCKYVCMCKTGRRADREDSGTLTSRMPPPRRKRSPSLTV